MRPVIRYSLVLLIFLICAVFASQSGGLMGDLYCFASWSSLIFEKGLPHAYDSYGTAYFSNNYMPLYQYVLLAYGHLQGSVAAIWKNIEHLKIVTLLFDFIGLWFVWRWVDKRVSYLLLLLICMLNLGYSYNTFLWGQVDAIHTAMVFASMYCLYTGRPLWSAVCMVLALNMKLQAIIFIPLWGLALLTLLKTTGRWKLLPAVAAVLLATQALIIAPFTQANNGLQGLWWQVTNATSTATHVSMNAANLWALLQSRTELSYEDSRICIAGLTYMQVGLLLFCVSSFFAMLPFLKALLQNKKQGLPSRRQIWLSCALVALSFFYFNTQMHERYSHPALLFITAYAFYSKRYVPYILMSIAYFLNLEVLLERLGVSYHTLLFDFRFMAALYTILMGYLFFRLYTDKDAYEIPHVQKKKVPQAAALS